MINKGRDGLFKTLIEMGAKIKIFSKKNIGGEETASIIAEYSQLKGVSVPSKRVPSMIDEYPILSIAASCADGKTIMDGISELRVKESDRIKIISNGLIKAGVKTLEKAESLTIYGSKVVGGCSIDSELDHRIANVIFNFRSDIKEPIKVLRPSTIETSFPNFYKIMIELAQTLLKHNMIIAIDGTASSGKGSLAKNLSESLNLYHLDTGIFYRVLAYQAIKLKINNKIDLIELSKNLSINKIIEIKKLKGKDLRSALISEKIFTNCS